MIHLCYIISQMNHSPSVLLLSAPIVEWLCPLDLCVDAVAKVFKEQGEGEPLPAGVLGVPLPNGGFHIKAAARSNGRGYFAAKLNGNFPGNPCAGLPTIQGLVILSDSDDGTPLAVIDSASVTRLRTAAATAVAARHLALRGADVALIVGCGAQALAQLAAIHEVRPLAGALAFDSAPQAAIRFAAHASKVLGIPVQMAGNLADAALAADVIVTCTPSRAPFLETSHVRAGAFIAAVGADHPAKCEIAPALMARSAIVTDVTAQCAAYGDLHHALVAGAVALGDVRAELGDVVAGRAAGRRDDEEVVVFDSTGTPIQDVALAALAYERAVACGSGRSFRFGG